MNKIYITIYNDVSERDALVYARRLVETCPDGKGTLRFANGICATFSNKAKGTAIQIWNQNVGQPKE